MSVTIPEYGGCLWPVDPACLADDWENLSPEVQTRALALASSTLQRLTAFRVGGCPVTVRPCAPRGYTDACLPFTGSFGTDWMSPGINGSGQWVNSCGCSGSCGCTMTAAIELPMPIGEVYEVKVDGNVIDPLDYDVRSNRWLVWVGDGPSPFPATQNMSRPDTLPDTFSVSYLNSYPVDQLGAQAAAFLAMEFAKACKGKGKCALPRGVTQVVRNGTSFSIEAGLFPNGRTGIDIVDGFIDMWNPDHRTQQTKVWTPSQARAGWR